MVRRTKEQADETRHRILDAAEQVFQGKGVSRTTLDDIARRAGCTRGAIYWHFENKAAVFKAMMARVTLPTTQPLERPAQDDTADPLVQIQRFAHDVFMKTARDPQACRVFDIAAQKVERTDGRASPFGHYQAVCMTTHARFEAAITRARKLGLVARTARPRTAAIALYAIIEGLIRNWVIDPRSFKLIEEGDRAVAVYVDGLRAAAKHRGATRKRATADARSRRLGTPP